MIPTAITAEETAALVELARERVVLELGAQFGHSTVAMAEVALQVWSVDWHHGDPQAGFQYTLPAYFENVRAAAGVGRIIPVVGKFADVLPMLRPASFDLIFHDGLHELEAMVHDLTLARGLLRWSGAIACHDYGIYDVAEATAGVIGPPHRVVGSLAIWQSRPATHHL
jgi:predicted O-methyltransferase YrrM